MKENECYRQRAMEKAAFRVFCVPKPDKKQGLVFSSGFHQTMLAHELEQGDAADAQILGALAAIPSVSFQCSKNADAFELLFGTVQGPFVETDRLLLLLHVGVMGVVGDQFLDPGFQLTDVARPVPAHPFQTQPEPFRVTQVRKTVFFDEMVQQQRKILLPFT